MRKGFSSKNSFIYLLTFTCFLLTFNGFGQEKKPKVALVLSGGGAKGIAHIPLLQTLDSLGIVPDLIVGNSMGSVVGGLYAMGYSGDSIANIVKQANWEQLIGGKVSLKNVSVEEKTEFNRYLIELGYVNRKVKLGKFLLNDQNLRQFISMLTFPSYKITDFDKLPIPFRAVATDIVNGKVVVLDRGSLALAMRASMSLPGVFSPVPYDETLLVDGAIMNNFPVDVAKDLGADIIIGSDVGDGLMGKKELQNISSLLFQAGMLSSHLINAKTGACQWELPGGKVEKGEFFDEALIREFKEETNLDVTLGEFYEAIQQDFVKKRTVQLIINVIPENYNVKISEEHIDYSWVDIEKIKTLDITEGLEKILNKKYGKIIK